VTTKLVTQWKIHIGLALAAKNNTLNPRLNSMADHRRGVRPRIQTCGHRRCCLHQLDWELGSGPHLSRHAGTNYTIIIIHQLSIYTFTEHSLPHLKIF
jgi:hypothetical protein